MTEIANCAQLSSLFDVSRQVRVLPEEPFFQWLRTACAVCKNQPRNLPQYIIDFAVRNAAINHRRADIGVPHRIVDLVTD